MIEDKPVIIFHYDRQGKRFSTPSLKIAIARKDTDVILKESVLGEESEVFNIEIRSSENDG